MTAAANPAHIVPVEDFSDATIVNLIVQLEASHSFEHCIYREAELDAVWRLLDIALVHVPAGAIAPPQIALLRDAVHTAHDLVADEQPAAAAASLRQALPPVGALPEDYLAVVRSHLERRGVRFAPGLSDAEVAEVEARYGFRFPPDLRSLLQFALPINDDFYDWRAEPESQIRRMLSLPFDGMAEFLVSEVRFWPEAWGPRPSDDWEALKAAQSHVERAPRLIPIYAHRYIPERPAQSGNPVFSTVQTDTICYGYDLADYLYREFRVPLPTWSVRYPRPIAFWDDVL